MSSRIPKLTRLISRRLRPLPKNIPKRAFALPKVVLVAQSAVFLKNNLDNLELNIHEALDIGEAAIAEVMDLLKDRIVESSEAYIECLVEQRKIVKEATDAGPLSGRWDDLVEFRSLGDELSGEIDSLTAALKAMVHSSNKESKKFFSSHKKDLDLIAQKYVEIERTLRTYSEEIKRQEGLLLEAKKQSIVRAK